MRDVVLVCQLNIVSDVEKNAVLHGPWLVTSGNTRGAEISRVSAPAPQAACQGGELPVNEGRPMCQKGYGAAASSRRSQSWWCCSSLGNFRATFRIIPHLFRSPAVNCCVVSQVEKAAPVV